MGRLSTARSSGEMFASGGLWRRVQLIFAVTFPRTSSSRAISQRCLSLSTET